MDREILAFKGAKRILAWIGVLTFFQGICIILQAMWLADAISELFAGKPATALLNKMSLFFAALVCRYLLLLLIKSLSYRFSEITGAQLRKAFLAKLFELGPRYIKKEGTGNLVTLALEGTAQMRQYLELSFPKITAMGILPILIVVYVFFLDKVSAIILMVTMPVLILFMVLLGLAAQKKMERQWASYRILSNHFVDSLRGLPTLRYLGLSRSHAGTIDQVSDRYRRMTMGTLRLAFLSSFALDFFTMMSIALVAVILGLRLINGHILLNPALTILILAPEYFLPIREFGQDYHATLDGREAAHAIQAHATTPSENSNIKKGSMNWDKKSELVLSDISVRHEKEGRPSLEHIALRANGFEKIGVIGTSGAGKTTLIDLLSGFLAPSGGEIRLNGEPLSTLTFGDWRRQVTYIPQHPYLFGTSLKKNVAFYRPNAGDEDIYRALKDAGLEKVVEQFPNGIDERIGGGGRSLSGGQEQRVAVARAFLCDRPILLLDEPTAHLDIETEYELKETMIRLFKGKLVFFATHRLHWMEQMDRVVVIKEGKIAEVGSQSELLSKKGAYFELVRSQLEGIQ